MLENASLTFLYAKYLPPDHTYVISFDLYKYLTFIGLFSIFGYAVLTLFTYKFDFEHNKKCLSKHYCDIVKSIYLCTFLYIFGGYTYTLDFLTIYGYFAGLIGFTVIAEIPFLHISLPSWRSWTKKAWIFMLSLGFILGLIIGYHIQLAFMNNVIWSYNFGLILVVVLLVICICTSHVDNRRVGMKNCGFGKVYIHLHHWQIFYVLAFFTRFFDPVSQFCGGIFIAIFIQGGCQYGFDDILEINEIKDIHILPSTVTIVEELKPDEKEFML